MRRFDACALCLQRARDPVACQKGHLFCRECALTDLGESTCLATYSFICRAILHARSGLTTDYYDAVTQMTDIKRQKVRLEAMKKEAEEERERAREAARERVLREFEKGQLGLAAKTSSVGIASGIPDTAERTSLLPASSHPC